MLPATINDQQAIECVGVILAPITNGKLTSPVQVHAACLLLDYGLAKVQGGGSQPPTLPTADFHTALASAHARQDPHAIPWPQLINIILQLLTTFGPILAGGGLGAGT